MTVISVETDHEHLVVTVVSEFEASVERVWELWADPRKLERWWVRLPTRQRSRLTTWSRGTRLSTS
jgi:uncharacterized protein YndB with AHSA1/START domain